MSTLSHLNEPGVLHNILIRFGQGSIYTFTGPILVAMNPYRVCDVFVFLLCAISFLYSSAHKEMIDVAFQLNSVSR